jgi:hypothetical protein
LQPFNGHVCGQLDENFIMLKGKITLKGGLRSVAGLCSKARLRSMANASEGEIKGYSSARYARRRNILDSSVLLR